MQIISFNAELALANLMFSGIFRDIKIKRTDANGNEKNIKVNCVFGQRSRILKNWQNAEKRAMMKLPMIVINRTSYTRNGDRLNNMHNEVKYEMTSKYRSYDLLTPIPIDITYDVVVMSKYPSDIDQIASNFMIFFNPDVYVSMQHPKYEGIKLNNQIIMSDSVNEDHPDELDGTADDFITCTFQFTFKTCLFGGNQQAKKIPQYILSSVTSSFVSSYVYELTNKDITQLCSFIKEHNNLSTILTSNVTADVNVQVLNPDISSYVYDGFTPIIKKIDIGFYPVQMSADIITYIDEVNNYAEQWPYVDRLTWNIQE